MRVRGTAPVKNDIRIIANQVDKLGQRLSGLRFRFVEASLPRTLKKCLSDCAQITQQIGSLRGTKSLSPELTRQLGVLHTEAITLREKILKSQRAFVQKEAMSRKSQDLLPSFLDVEDLERELKNPGKIPDRGYIGRIVRGRVKPDYSF